MNIIPGKLLPKAEKHVKKGHPWVFDQGIELLKKKGKTGDVVVLFDQKKNKFLAFGLLDLESPIRIKILQTHTPGKPNEAWILKKIQEAFEIRKPLLLTNTNSFRLLFGENDSLPGLICDVYDRVAVIKLYSGIWWPYLEWIVNSIVQTIDLDAVVLRLSRKLENNKIGIKDGQVIFGELSNEVQVFKEHGLLFEANVLKGHKTGYFLDHRANRKRVGELANGKLVLDVFSYAGGFSVHALVGGAKEVTSVDISKQALELAKSNAKLNRFSGNHHTVSGDAFDVLQKMQENRQKFDLIVIDPPSFAKQATEVDGALSSYERLTKLGCKLLAKNGVLVMASCSSRVSSEQFFELVEGAIKKNHPNYSLLSRWGHDIDHPVTFAEGAYLKCGFYQV
ncbi:MAG: class I SAM-dependent rRNA methyltransferase [Flavobacteriales bacterium]